MSKRKRVQKRRKIKVDKYKNGKLLIILLIILLSLLVVTYPFNKTPTKTQTPTKGQVKINDTIIYPGSSKKVVTENGGRTTINYQTQAGVSYQSVILYYVVELPRLGWKLISQSDVDAYFEKGSRKLRVWILYVTDQQDKGVDYILDYSEEVPTPFQIN